MRQDARVATAIALLDDILGGASAERTLTNWARQSRFAGSGDRNAVRDLVFDAIRRRRSCAWVGGAETGRGLMLGHFHMQGEGIDAYFTGNQYAPAVASTDERQPHSLDEAPETVRLDCPEWVWPDLQSSLGGDAMPVMHLLQARAPVFLRVNTRRGGRDKVIAMLADEGIVAKPHALSPTALEVIENPRRVKGSAAYRKGFVEIQDAASQAVVDVFLEEVKSGGSVLDFCAGGGGKSLALAASGALTVTAHDANPARMKDIATRAERAGVMIAEASDPKGIFDAVLCDAPCSGSGAWRRQPEAKWTLTREALDDLNSVQDSILDAASTLVAPGGCLAYATCSLLDQENSQRVEAFLTRNDRWIETRSRRFTPLEGGDGFFVSVLRRR